MPVRIQEEDFDAGLEVAGLLAANTQMGACVSFLGVVRSSNEGSSVSAMTLEHYPKMTEKAIEKIIGEAKGRWPSVGEILVVHRVGRLVPGDQIVLVAATGAHRGEAFDASEYVIDWLKTRAPFWKKEETPEGARWVDARESDDAAAAAWGSP